MKQSFLLPLSSIFFALILFTSCKKSDSEKEAPLTSAQIAAHTDDESLVSAETDAAMGDANIVLESEDTFSGDFLVVAKRVCDADLVIDTASNPMTITINYNGEGCTASRTRTGTVIISTAKATKWKMAGAVVSVRFQDLTITRVSDHKKIKLNGTHTYTNVTGGLLYSLSAQDSIVQTISSDNMSVSVDSTVARSWKIAKKRTYVYDNGIVLRITGAHTEGSLSNIAEWGTNRFDKKFTTTISSPLVFKQSCGFRLGAGTVAHVTGGFSATATFGLDITGLATVCPGEGHYYYKLLWSGPDGVPSSVILPY